MSESKAKKQATKHKLFSGVFMVTPGTTPTIKDAVPGAAHFTKRSSASIYLANIRQDGRAYVQVHDNVYLRHEDAAELADFFATLSTILKNSEEGVVTRA